MPALSEVTAQRKSGCLYRTKARKTLLPPTTYVGIRIDDVAGALLLACVCEQISRIRVITTSH